ncbi:MAG: phosphoribosylglycinamide formyltransferase [Bacteroidales bacterium]|jgi:phosphoribosylglycinamide formyltransferase-1|nr:phosphoribosylglycinamide formyltransferase [Bacteroidales bacterium]HNW48816.1 phosphoribosylglycinamide formyltransferase [Bacteroidales bacterium]HPS96038.1 phosphoribosylglycinamide formyltransferase [Bacteroidales bacterium]
MYQIKIAIFASGSGTNAENIVDFFKMDSHIKVSLILSNKNSAYVLERARKLGVKSTVFTADQLNNSTFVDSILAEEKIDAIILSGFLLKVPDRIIAKYSGRIINIHPALLPKFGGKGMYGMNVHKAVIDSGDTESGITIHLVDEHYDNGTILFQSTCNVEPGDTPESLAEKIHKLEYRYFPEVIGKYLQETVC